VGAPGWADNSETTPAINGIAVTVRMSARPVFIAWLLLALTPFAMGPGQPIRYTQNASSRAMAAPTRLSGVDAPEVKPIATAPDGGNHPVAVSSVFDPTGR
jgi:hypothetical protein